MSTYKGAAVLLINDGRQFDTDADLSKDSSGSWQGTLTFRDNDLVPMLLSVEDGYLLVRGRPGQFVRPDRSDWTFNGGNPFVVRILGNGDAPF